MARLRVAGGGGGVQPSIRVWDSPHNPSSMWCSCHGMARLLRVSRMAQFSISLSQTRSPSFLSRSHPVQGSAVQSFVHVQAVFFEGEKIRVTLFIFQLGSEATQLRIQLSNIEMIQNTQATHGNISSMHPWTQGCSCLPEAKPLAYFADLFLFLILHSCTAIPVEAIDSTGRFRRLASSNVTRLHNGLVLSVHLPLPAFLVCTSLRSDPNSVGQSSAQ